jgi:hypothetical protein
LVWKTSCMKILQGKKNWVGGQWFKIILIRAGSSATERYKTVSKWGKEIKIENSFLPHDERDEKWNKFVYYTLLGIKFTLFFNIPPWFNLSCYYSNFFE